MQSNRTRAENHKFYDNLYEKFSSFCDSGEIILMRDFNTRTPILQDNIADGDNSNNNNFCNLPEFYQNDMVMQRNYLDDLVNESETLLTDLCHGANLRMLNCRFVGDLMGFYIFLHYNHCYLSTIDYIIAPESKFVKCSDTN